MAGKDSAPQYKRKNGGILYVIITILLMSLATIIGVGVFFTIAEIQVDGVSVYTSEEVVAASGIEIGDNLFFTSDSSAVIKIRKELSNIENIVIERKFPDTLRIKITENFPVAYTISGGEKWLIDRKCTILEDSEDVKTAERIKIEGLKLVEPQSGETMKTEVGDSQVKYLKELLTALYDYDALDNISNINIESISNITFNYTDNYKVDLGAQGEITDKIALLVKTVEGFDEGSKGEIQFSSGNELHFIPE